MMIRRLTYLICLAGSLVFYFCYQQWVSWMLLWVVIALPWVSLLLSLPAMVQFRAELEAPAFVELGSQAHTALWGLSQLPQPLFRGQIFLENLNTGKVYRHHPLRPLPTAHCGGWKITAKQVKVCDYLGLFRLPVRNSQDCAMVIRPQPVPMEHAPAFQQAMAKSWRPKFGGGYAEQHELRLYRPGDNLNQIHWKLSAKTGDLILREPMVPHLGRVMLTMDFYGTPEEIDQKCGRLLWLGRELLTQGLEYEIRCLTGEGVVASIISCESQLNDAIDRLLCCPLATEGTLATSNSNAQWQFHLGGDLHEV